MNDQIRLKKFKSQNQQANSHIEQADKIINRGRFAPRMNL